MYSRLSFACDQVVMTKDEVSNIIRKVVEEYIKDDPQIIFNKAEYLAVGIKEIRDLQIMEDISMKGNNTFKYKDRLGKVEHVFDS